MAPPRRGVGVLAFAALLAACGGAPSVPGTPPAPTPSPTPGGSPQPDGWEVLEGSPASPANSHHDDLVFLDEENGWLVNTRGEVYATRDGGATWTALFFGRSINRMRVVNDSLAYACGDRVYRWRR